jgi:hypothetical protein
MRASGHLALIALLGAGGQAHAAPECAHAYESAQEHRAEGRLKAAQQRLLACAQASCPAFIRSDCSRWLAEVQAAQPTVVFVVRRGGRDLVDVAVTCDGERLAGGLGGRAVPLDPGKHTCRIEAPASPAASMDLLVVEGQKSRVVQIDLPPGPGIEPPARRNIELLPPPPPPRAYAAGRGRDAVAAEAAASPSGGAAPSPVAGAARAVPAPPARALASLPPVPRAESDRGARLPIVPLVLAGAGTVGVAGFIALGASGLSAEHGLQARCAPHCSAAEVSSVRARYLLADVSLAVGLASVAAAALVYRAWRGATRAQLALGAGPGGATVIAGSSF